jgi:hypothetical protein
MFKEYGDNPLNLSGTESVLLSYCGKNITPVAYSYRNALLSNEPDSVSFLLSTVKLKKNYFFYLIVYANHFCRCGSLNIENIKY